VDKHEREQLKHDVFVEEVTHSIDYAKHHQKQLTMYGGIAVAALAAGFGWWWWSDKQLAERQKALKEAVEIQQASIGPGQNPYVKVFPTQAEKDAAIIKSFSGLAAKYPGKQEGDIGTYFLGIANADQGKLDEAEKEWLKAVNGGGSEIAALARFSLGQMYVRQNKLAEAEKHFRYLVDHSTTFVSKENAQIELAKVLAKTNPAEAQKILEPLRQMSTRNQVSRWAITAYGDTRPGPKP